MEKIKNLKQISIRGRVAFAIQSLENALEDTEITDYSLMDKVLNFLKTYTHTQYIDQWEEKANELAPFLIFDEEDFIEEDFSHINKEEYIRLKNLYTSLPSYITDLIDCVIGIGTANLYGGTQKYSPLSYKHVLNLINILKENNIPIPPVDNYKKYPFKTEDEGWGECFKYPENN